MKSKYIVVMGLILAIIMVGAVSATDTVSEDIVSDDDIPLEIKGADVYTTGKSSFTNLTDEIETAGESLDLNQDYAFNNETDNNYGIAITKDNFVVNGNGRTIDGKNQSRIFDITANNITLSNLILTGGNAKNGGAIYSTGALILDNVTFIDNYAINYGGSIIIQNAILTCNNSRFIDNYANCGSSICIFSGNLNICNTNITSKRYNREAQIYVSGNDNMMYMENVTFTNITSSYSSALYLESTNASITNSKFINLKANVTAGAICVKEGGELYFKNCEFTNTTSSKNGGAIYADIYGGGQSYGVVYIFDTIFNDTYSEFGGSYLQLGGFLFINNTKFINNHAAFNGGAIYLSSTNGLINSSTFYSNGVELYEFYPTYGGAIFCDLSELEIDNSKFINNTASEGSAVYTYDTAYTITNSIFENNMNPIFTVFDHESILENNSYINDDDISTGNVYYATIMYGEGMQLTLLNNTISVDVPPSKFDLRDWGWVSPVRDQGFMGSCWTFSMTGSLESALLKSTGMESDFSENSIQNSMLWYSSYGSIEVEGGFNTIAAGYLLGWLGAFRQNADTYDERGKISPLIMTAEDIHVQDVIYVPNNEIPNGTQIKSSIMKYGALFVCYYADFDIPYYNPETSAHYVNESLYANHAVAVVGWDDNYPKENFFITPPGDGAWIIKNSWGTDWGDDGYLYISYYDQSFLSYAPNDLLYYAMGIIFENTVPYHVNYQYDISWMGEFMPSDGNISYMNVFGALDDDLIAAVGTYFNESGVDYTVEIFVNDELKLTQTGVSPYIGYHTIKLNEYIPIKAGDIFQAKITSNSIPFITMEYVRVHYTENISLMSTDGVNWNDGYDLGIVACLKVYTVVDDSKIINNNDITVDYAGGSYFSVKVVTDDGHAVGAGEVVKFTINKVNSYVTTDENGIAKIKINDAPGTHLIVTTYNGKVYQNTVTVKNVLIASKVTIKKKTAKNLALTAKLKINGKLVKGKWIKFKLNGHTYKVKTNKNGIAKKILGKKVIKTLKKGKTYKVKVIFANDIIKTTLKVK